MMDILTIFKESSKWIYLGYHDIYLKYSRSFLGPWWSVLTVTVILGFLSSVWSQIFDISLMSYLPHLIICYIFWLWISSTLLDLSNFIIDQSSLISQIKISHWVLLMRVFFRNTLILLHNSLIIVLMFIVLKMQIDLISFAKLIVIFFISSIFLISNGMLLAILVTRFRDFLPIVSTVINLIFFITPIIWDEKILNKNIFILDINPIYWILNLIESSLIERLSMNYSYLINLILVTLISLILSILVHKIYRSKIIHWL